MLFDITHNGVLCKCGDLASVSVYGDKSAPQRFEDGGWIHYCVSCFPKEHVEILYTQWHDGIDRGFSEADDIRFILRKMSIIALNETRKKILDG